MIFKNLYPLSPNGTISISDMSTAVKSLQHGYDGIYLTSAGGSCIGFPEALPDILRRKFTVVGGEIIGSFAIDLFLCGRERFILPDTTFFLHEIRLQKPSGETMTVSALEMEMEQKAMTRNLLPGELEYTKNLYAYAKELEAFLVRWHEQRTKLSANCIMQMMRANTTLSAQEAVYYGFANQIIDPYKLRV